MVSSDCGPRGILPSALAQVPVLPGGFVAIQVSFCIHAGGIGSG